MKKKILALALVVVLAVTAVTGATLAYFTDKDDATNTFTVGGNKLADDHKADVNTDAAFEADTDVVDGGEFQESKFRSAPYFDVRIDGIKLLNEKF